MAQLLLINNKTARENLQYVGDIVDVYEDGRWLSDSMLEKFDVVTIKGTADDVKRRLREKQPVIADAFKWESDGKYHFDLPPEDDYMLDKIEAYQASKNWYRIESDFKFFHNYAELTAEEKQSLEAEDVTSINVDQYLEKMTKDISQVVGNDVEVRELRNLEPING